MAPNREGSMPFQKICPPFTIYPFLVVCNNLDYHLLQQSQFWPWAEQTNCTGQQTQCSRVTALPALCKTQLLLPSIAAWKGPSREGSMMRPAKKQDLMIKPALEPAQTVPDSRHPQWKPLSPAPSPALIPWEDKQKPGITAPECQVSLGLFSNMVSQTSFLLISSSFSCPLLHSFLNKSTPKQSGSNSPIACNSILHVIFSSMLCLPILNSL